MNASLQMVKLLSLGLLFWPSVTARDFHKAYDDNRC